MTPNNTWICTTYISDTLFVNPDDNNELAVASLLFNGFLGDFELAIHFFGCGGAICEILNH